ncbi:DUF6191 domain-containing protein [Streptomyces sp. NPDC058092]|uniref:DUF6191 domain-containing protein n=1 Tax=Streptomyces sp. NPDC058092 TaxID=3346336 RepID=UPI0036E989CB
MRPVFNFFEELFAPGRKHAAEEQKRLELTRVDLGVGDPGRGPVDLASGKVIIRAPADGADSDGGAGTGAGGAGADSARAGGAGADSARAGGAGADSARADSRERAPGPDVPDGPQAGPDAGTEEAPESGPRA